jgi:hypothetical protein
MAGPLIPNVMGLLIPMILGDLSQHRLFVSSLVSSLVSGSLARISSVKSARSSIQTKVDRDPRSNLAYQRCVPLTDPCSLACRSSFPDPVPRSERSGSPATMVGQRQCQILVLVSWNWKTTRPSQSNYMQCGKQVHRND